MAQMMGALMDDLRPTVAASANCHTGRLDPSGMGSLLPYYVKLYVEQKAAY